MHFDLVAVMSVEAVAGTPIDLEEVVGHRLRLTQRRSVAIA